MKIINIDIDKVIPYVNNPRNNDESIDKVAASIIEFGFKVPILIDKNNTIITGHTRVLASKKIGLSQIPAIIADDLTDKQIKAFRIADNKVSEYSKWDNELLRIELEQLEEMDFDLDSINIDYTDFQGLDLFIDDIDLPDELELERTEQERVSIKKLKFGSYNIALSDEEFKMLTVLVERYIEKTGVVQGFVNDLVGGMF